MNSEKRREILEKIHHIDHARNRWLGVPIFIGSAVTVLLLLILPYRGRVALAFVLNVLFNRPLVYMNFAARYIAKPFAAVEMRILYFVVFGSYALLYRIFAKPTRDGWVPSQPSSKDDFRYQS